MRFALFRIFHLLNLSVLLYGNSQYSSGIKMCGGVADCQGETHSMNMYCAALNEGPCMCYSRNLYPPTTPEDIARQEAQIDPKMLAAGWTPNVYTPCLKDGSPALVQPCWKMTTVLVTVLYFSFI